MHLAEVSKILVKGAVLTKEAPGMSSVSVLDADYADYMALMDNTKDGLQETTDLLSYYSAFFARLKINVQNTKSSSQRP